MGKARTEASRAERKAKKRAAEDAIPDVPDSWAAEPEVEISQKEQKESKKRKRSGGNDDDDDDAPVVNGEKESKKDKKKRRKEAEANGEGVHGEVEGAREEKKEKKVKKEKKEKKTKNEEKVEEPADVDTEMADAPVDEAPKKSKKERKAERKAKEAAEAAANGTAKSTDDISPKENGEKKPTGKEETAEEKKSKKNNRNREKKRKGESSATGANGEATEKEGSGKPARFIVFVGNLPFTANSASVEKHFASVKPKSVRAPTEKDQSTKSKGFAFVEFEGYDHMKTCLKLLHHSMFDDGISAPRQINVELTAGGGGNTKGRREKIEVKNTKLNEERVRRVQEEKKAKLTKQAEGGKKDLIDESAIHPSRRGRVPVV